MQFEQHWLTAGLLARLGAHSSDASLVGLVALDLPTVTAGLLVGETLRLHDRAGVLASTTQTEENS